MQEKKGREWLDEWHREQQRATKATIAERREQERGRVNQHVPNVREGYEARLRRA